MKGRGGRGLGIIFSGLWISQSLPSHGRRLLRQFEPPLADDARTRVKLRNARAHTRREQGEGKKKPLSGVKGAKGVKRGKGGEGKEKKGLLFSPSSVPVVGVSTTLKQLNSKTSRERESGESGGEGGGGRHYANYIMNPSDVKEKEKMPVDSLGSSEAGRLFFAAPMEFRHGQRENSARMLLSTLSFRSLAGSLSLFACLRALRIQAAFLSLFEPLIWLYQLESVPFCPRRVCILFVPSAERVPRLPRANAQPFSHVVRASRLFLPYA